MQEYSGCLFLLESLRNSSKTLTQLIKGVNVLAGKELLIPSPYNPFTISTTYPSIISLIQILIICGFTLFSLINFTDTFKEPTFSFIDLLYTPVFYFTNFHSSLYYIHSSGKCRFHLLYFFKFPKVKAEVADWRPPFFAQMAFTAINFPLMCPSSMSHILKSFLFSNNSKYFQISLDFFFDPWATWKCVAFPYSGFFQTIFL